MPPGQRAAPAGAPPVVVAGPASAYAGAIIRAGGHAIVLNPAQLDSVVPLLAARAFIPPEAQASYGLAPVRAELLYRRTGGGVIDLALGSPTFDNHFIYVEPSASLRIFTVASDSLRPLLALVGVVVPPDH